MVWLLIVSPWFALLALVIWDSRDTSRVWWFNQTEAIKIETKEAAISRKDLVALSISATALVVALTGAWFQFFRSESHLKLTVASSFHAIGSNVQKLGDLEIQDYKDSYSIGLLDDGNKDILIKSISRTIYRIGAVVSDEDLTRGVLATAQLDADGTPICPRKPASQLHWQTYEHEGQVGQQGALVIKANQFFTMNKLKFADFFLPREFAAKGGTESLLICFNISFVKPNGTEGAGSIPVARLLVARGDGTPGSPDLLTHAGRETLSKLQPVDE